MIEQMTERLSGVHAAEGDASTRLCGILAEVEGANWALLLADVRALARQLVARLGKGLVRVDPRVPVNRDLFAVHGLAIATTDADWRGANAVWLLNPDEKALKRARKAGVPVIVDGTLAPGGTWFTRGADLVVYRNAVALTGFTDAAFVTLLGNGEAPRRAAPGPSDLAVALALRDLATLPLRAVRQADTAARVLATMPGRAQAVTGGTLLFAHEALPTDHPAWDAPLGGVRTAAMSVPAGTLVSVGLEEAEAVLASLAEEAAPTETAEVTSMMAPMIDAPEPDDADTDIVDHAIPDTDADENLSDDQDEDTAPPVASEIVFSDATPRSESPAEAPVSGLHVDPAEDDMRLDDETGEDEAYVPDEDMTEPDLTPEPEPEVHIHDLHPDLPTPEAGADAVADLTDEQRAVFMRLREWRNAEAKRQEVSRFIIASNATLAEIARRAPQNAEELREVRGMGPQRLQKYGAQIVRVVWGL